MASNSRPPRTPRIALTATLLVLLASGGVSACPATAGARPAAGCCGLVCRCGPASGHDDPAARLNATGSTAAPAAHGGSAPIPGGIACACRPQAPAPAAPGPDAPGREAKRLAEAASVATSGGPAIDPIWPEPTSAGPPTPGPSKLPIYLRTAHLLI